MGLEGSDRSHYQGDVTYRLLARWKRAGRTHLGLKASEGHDTGDPTFSRARRYARLLRIPRWLYHEMTDTEPEPQLANIMGRVGRRLFLRERLCLVLGDYHVRPEYAAQLVQLLQTRGPTKGRLHPHRPLVILYYNLANVPRYAGVAPGNPRIVAAYPGPIGTVKGAVIHQDADRDPAPGLGGDHDVWLGQASTIDPFFRQ